jgi:UDP-N-acetylmuramate dehydrogenase
VTDDGLVVRPYESLARHTPWRTGGTATAFVTAHTEDGLVTALRDCRQASVSVQLLGAGTRVVYRDGDVDAVVLRLGGELATIRVDGDIIDCGAGAPVPAVVAVAESHGLTGLEGFATTPGTVGAAVLFDDGWAEVVEAVQTISRDKVVDAELDKLRRKKKGVVVRVRLRLKVDPSGTVPQRTRAVWRAQQPGPPNSWFEPLRKQSARSVLRTVQLPLVRLRRVAIPETAPECLINLGGGTAADLALLHRSAVDRVKKVRGISLESPLKWVGSRG